MKNDALKKHHFWILLGLVPLFVLIATVMISSKVGGAIDKRIADIEKAKKDISSKSNPKPNALLNQMDDTIKQISEKQLEIWRDAWERQKGLFVWPQSKAFSNFARKVKDAGGKPVKDENGKDKEEPVDIRTLRFGDYIPNNESQFQEFRLDRFYRALYSTEDKKKGVQGTTGMADRVLPTQFRGGWENILRHVNTWGDAELSSDQVWLLMEDVWVQRAMLEAVRSVNVQMADFARVKYEKDGKVIDNPAPKAAEKNPLERKFRSRIWEVELKVTEKDGKHYISGKLRNITDRLQLMGIATNKKGERVNGLTLNVWLDDPAKGALPFALKIGGDFLPGQGAVKPVLNDDGKPVLDKDRRELMVPANVIDITTIDSDGNEVPLGTNVSEIFKIEQVFDIRTVPIRQIAAMALGFPDSRHANSALKPPKFIKIEEPPPGDSGQPGAGGLMGGSASGPPGGKPGTSGGGAPPTAGGDPRGGGGGSGSGSTAAGLHSGGGSVEAVVDANKKRYTDVTDQVRRMPVGIVVVVDQAYIQDVLLAFANSPLRFQITQVTWNRFRGTIESGLPAGGSTGGDPGNQVVGSGPAAGGSYLGTADPDIPSAGGKPGVGDSGMPPRGGGSSAGPPMGMGTSGGGAPSAVGSGGPGSGGAAGQPTTIGLGSGGSGGAITNISEAQLTSGLVELHIYGIVSLYTSPDTPAADGGAAKEKDKDTAKEKGKDKEPAKEKDKEPVKEKDKEKEPAKEPMPMTTTTPKMRRRLV